MPTDHKKRERLLLRAIQQEEQESKSFEDICNSDCRIFGSPGTKKRQSAQFRRRNLLTLAKANPTKYLSILRDHELPEKMPSEKQTRSVEQQGVDPKKKMSTKEPSSEKKELAYEEENPGKWFNYADGTEGYAELLVPIRYKRGQGHLNGHVKLVQHLPKVSFRRKDVSLQAECFAIFDDVEKVDIDLGLVVLRRTSQANILAYTKPDLPASLRVDRLRLDDADDVKDKLKAVCRNFMIRDMKTGMMSTFWVPEAWVEHQKTIHSMAIGQKEDGKEFEVPCTTYLLVFPKEVRFSAEVDPESEDEDGIIARDSEPFLGGGDQMIFRMRWLIPTENFEVVRKDPKARAVDRLAERLDAALNFAKQGGTDVQGEIF